MSTSPSGFTCPTFPDTPLNIWQGWGSSTRFTKNQKEIFMFPSCPTRGLLLQMSQNLDYVAWKWIVPIYIKENWGWGGFSGGPLVKTSHSQCRGSGFNHWWGNYIPHSTSKNQHCQINIKKKKKELNCIVDFSVSCNSLILFYTLLAFVCYWQFLKVWDGRGEF